MTKKYTFKTQFNRTPESIRDISNVEFTAPSMVKESLSYAVDINTIYENYCKTGKIPLNGNKPIYDENFINYDNLVEAQHAVKEASSYFATLPSDIRKQYGNSLEEFVKAIHSNDQFLQDKGVLVKSEPAVKPVVKPAIEPVVKPVVPVVSPTNECPKESTTATTTTA